MLKIAKGGYGYMKEGEKCISLHNTKKYSTLNCNKKYKKKKHKTKLLDDSPKETK